MSLSEAVVLYTYVCVAELGIGRCVTSPSDQQEECTEGGKSGRAREPFSCGDTQG